MDLEAVIEKGASVEGGQVIGHVQETETIVHKIMVPPTMSGVVKDIKSGDFNVTETVCTLEDGSEIQMMQKWPVRTPRPYRQKYAPDTPLITGMRILDFLFPSPRVGQQVFLVHSVQEDSYTTIACKVFRRSNRCLHRLWRAWKRDDRSIGRVPSLD